MKFEKSCGTVVFRKARGKYAVLLIKNRYTDFWSFPKGHVEAGENEYQTFHGFTDRKDLLNA